MKRFNLKYYLLLVGLLTLIPVNSQNSYSKITFKKYRNLTKKGEEEFSKLTDSILEKKFKSQHILSGLTKAMLKNSDIVYKRLNSSEVKIHLEIKNDSIWRFETINSNKPQKYILIDQANNEFIYFNNTKNEILKKVNFDDNKDSEYILNINKSDTKIIKGIKCHKIQLIHKTYNPEFGNTIYDFYVTDKINIPFFSVVKIKQQMKNLFPLEIRMRPEKKASGIELVYELIELK